MSNWEIASNDGTNVVARHSVTGQRYSGTLINFNAMISGGVLDTGNVQKTGAGVITTSENVAHCKYHRIINTHATAAVTVDVSFDDGSTWTTGYSVKLKDNTFAASLAAGAVGILEGKFDRVRASCSVTSSGRITSYTAAQY